MSTGVFAHFIRAIVCVWLYSFVGVCVTTRVSVLICEPLWILFFSSIYKYVELTIPFCMMFMCVATAAAAAATFVVLVLRNDPCVSVLSEIKPQTIRKKSEGATFSCTERGREG